MRGISEQAQQRLLDYDWPGNVRELEHVIERAVVLAEGSVIMPRDLTYFSVNVSDQQGLSPDGRLATMERLHIAKALVSFDGHRAKTAEYLGIDRKTLRAKIIRYGLSDESGNNAP